MALLGLALHLLVPMVTLAAAKAQAQIVSPEVHADRTVTFRYRDVGAKKVDLGLEGRDAIPMEKGANGVWTVTTEPLAPDLYGYTFGADGETRVDVRNAVMKPNLIWQSSMFLVPGNPPEAWEVQDVPHGTLHHHFYKSDVIGDQRDFFVYTPPGFRPGKKYPVLYLLHGYSDMASGWSEVGKANLIMDSLIAQGKTKPMLVVMPLGYGVPDFANPFHPANRERGMGGRSYENYKKGLLTEVIPAVEREYRVSSDRKDRAIAGLSMGGAESLFVGLNSHDKFSYVGAFSSGGLAADFATDFPGLDATKANKQLKLLYVSCGTDDGLITFNRNLVKFLNDKQIKVQSHETPGRHAWMVWRRNLIDFSQQLFK